MQYRFFFALLAHNPETSHAYLILTILIKSLPQESESNCEIAEDSQPYSYVITFLEDREK